jgi:hypothetical protein
LAWSAELILLNDSAVVLFPGCHIFLQHYISKEIGFETGIDFVEDKMTGRGISCIPDVRILNITIKAMTFDNEDFIGVLAILQAVN